MTPELAGASGYSAWQRELLTRWALPGTSTTSPARSPAAVVGTLHATLDARGKLLPERCTIIVRGCPGCGRVHVVPARFASGFLTAHPCGTLLVVQIDESAWRVLEREHSTRTQDTSGWLTRSRRAEWWRT